MKRGTTSVKAARGSRSVDERASGEGDLPMRTMGAKELGRDAVATGRKAAKGRRGKKEAGILPNDAVATGRKVGKAGPAKNISKLKAAAAAAASSEAKKKPAAASASGAGDVTSVVAGTAAKEGGLRLPQDYDYASPWEPEFLEDPDDLYARMINNPAFSLEDVEKRTELQRELVEQSKECAAHVDSFHAWVRSEFEEKGYVEFDDDYIAQGVLLRQAMEEHELYALAFGPIDGLVAEGDDVKFALARPKGAAVLSGN